MKITLKRINFLSSDYGKISRLYKSAFPADERAPMWLLALKSKGEDVDFWGLYSDEKWAGLAYVILFLYQSIDKVYTLIPPFNTNFVKTAGFDFRLSGGFSYRHCVYRKIRN